MANLADRLKRIRQSRPGSGTGDKKLPAGAAVVPFPRGLGKEWKPAGYKTLKRELFYDGVFSSFSFSFKSLKKNQSFFPRRFAIVAPDLFRYAEHFGEMPSAEDILFFDLETSGLSSGAGTVAFLAAFGRFAEGGLIVTQYLLLDFPGESDFLNAALEEFSPVKFRGRPPLAVSYNGKTFDFQVLKTRCLMNGFSLPSFFHADLLHPCRRFWKNKLSSCSQGTIEKEIIGIERDGDTPGALAPDIWFSFLKTGEAASLEGISNHNYMDICGLAGIFLCLAEIASSPLGRGEKYGYDVEAMALRWRKEMRGRPLFFAGEEERYCVELQKALLDNAAKENSPRMLRILALEAEWKDGDLRRALFYTEKILSLEITLPGLEKETLRRRERLLAKIKAEK